MDARNLMTDFCSRISLDPLLVQGAGGNVSWKDSDVLWVKASGKWISRIKSEDIFIGVDLLDLAQQLNQDSFSYKPKTLMHTELRPSIETFIHALMPQKFVVHLHAVEPLAHLVRGNAKTELFNLLRSVDLSWTFINYKKPGEKLAAEIKRVISNCLDTDILLLESHGVVLADNCLKSLEKKLNKLNCALSLPILYRPLIISDEILSELTGYKPINHFRLHNLVFDEILFNKLEESWALYPDHLVFLGRKARKFKNWTEAKSEILKEAILPEVIFIKNTGIFVTELFDAGKLEQLCCYYEILIRQPKNMTLRVLSNSEIDELINWDAEIYRQAMK